MPEDSNRVSTLGDIAYYLSNIDPEQSLEFAKKTIDLAKKINDPPGIVNGYYKCSLAYMTMGNFDQAIHYGNLALAQTIKIKDTTRMTFAHNLLGVIYSRISNTEKSIHHLFNSAKLSELDGDEMNAAYAYNNIGEIYYNNLDDARAREYYLEAKRILENSGEAEMLVTVYNNLGQVAETPGEKKSYLLKAIEIGESLAYSNGLAYAYSSLAGHYWSLEGNRDTAYYLYGKAIDFARNTGDHFILLNLLIDRGGLASELSQMAESEALLAEALEIATENNQTQQIQEALQYQAENFYKQGNFKAAYESMWKSASLRDTLYNAEMAEKLADANTKFETEQKNAQISAQQLKISQQENVRNRLLLFGILTILILSGVFQWYYNKQKRKKREAEVALELKHNESQNLKKLDLMKSHFFTNIAHELRTPLTLILGPLENAKDLTQEKHLQEDLDLAHRNGQRLLSLVDEILDLSKLEAGKLEVIYSDIDLSNTLKRILYSFESLAKIRNVHLNFNDHLEQNLVVKTDLKKLEKIVSNIVSNAIKHTLPEGMITVTLTKISSDAHSAKFEIAISDTGTGIHQEDLPHIFNRYFQSTKANKLNQGGTGVGLALTKEYTELLGGEIYVDSKMGEGSCFKIILPFEVSGTGVIPEDDKRDSETLKPIVAPLVYNEGEKPIVLVVEDHPEMNEYIQSILKDKYHCIRAYDGVEALQILQKQRIDIVTSDVMMPRMDGFQLREAVNRIDKLKDMPFVLLTARSLEQDKIKGLKLGIDDYITKPFNAIEFKTRLNNLLQNKLQRESWRQEEGIEVLTKDDPADIKLLNKIKEAIYANLDQPDFKIRDLARQTGYGERQLRRVIKKMTGYTPVEMILEIRLQKARQLLEEGRHFTVSEVRYQVGIESASYFSRKYTQRFGKNPKEVIDTIFS